MANDEQYLDTASKRSYVIAFEIVDKYSGSETEDVMLASLMIAISYLLTSGAKDREHLSAGLAIVHDNIEAFCADAWKATRAD